MTAFAETPGARLARGVCRWLIDAGAAPVCEFSPAPGLRVDVIALWPDGRVQIVEVKASRADFLSDRKWAGYLPWCDRFSFAVAADFPVDLLPPDVGALIADPYGAEPLRAAPERPLAAARRAALTRRLACAAALRLRAVLDPGQPPPFA